MFDRRECDLTMELQGEKSEEGLGWLDQAIQTLYCMILHIWTLYSRVEEQTPNKSEDGKKNRM